MSLDFYFVSLALCCWSIGRNPHSHSPHHSGNLAPTITFLSPNSPSSYCYSAQKSFHFHFLVPQLSFQLFLLSSKEFHFHFLVPNSPSNYCYSAQKSFSRLAKKVKVNMNTFGPLGVSNQSIRSLPCRFGVMVRREVANM